MTSTTIASQVLPHKASPSTSKGPRRTPPGCRVLYAYVRESTFNHAKAQALLSGMPFVEYINRLLAEAKPYPTTGRPDGTTKALASAAG